MNQHAFLNVSVTPIECSVICCREIAEEIFRPLIDRFNSVNDGVGKHTGSQIELEPKTYQHRKGKAHISAEDYVVVEVDGQGLDAGQRVLELTSPLAMAGMYALALIDVSVLVSH